MTDKNIKNIQLGYVVLVFALLLLLTCTIGCAPEQKQPSSPATSTSETYSVQICSDYFFCIKNSLYSPEFDYLPPGIYSTFVVIKGCQITDIKCSDNL